MSLVPRSLFGRNVLLLLALFAFNLVCSVWVLRECVQKPRVAQLADLVARQIRSLQDGLQVLSADQQAVLLLRLNAGGDVRAVPAVAASPLSEPPSQSPLTRLFLNTLVDRLPPSVSDVRWSSEDQGTLWVHTHLAGQAYWLIVPRIKPETYPATALGLMAISTVLSLIGAALIQRRIHLPLSRLVRAANQIANGEVAEPLSEQSPEEIATVARAFNHMRTSLAQIDAERAVLLAGISHDLRTPLAKMRLAIEMLSRDGDPTLIGSMLRSAAEMDAIVEQFLEFARGENIRDRHLVDSNRLVRECAAVYAACGQALHLDLQELPWISLHPQSIARALNNLIENALRYAGPDVLLQSRCQDGVVQLSVLDRGPGVPESQIARLKRPFTRGDNTRGIRGVGLGLAIVERIALHHGGGLTLLSREGGGLHARIDLPYVE